MTTSQNTPTKSEMVVREAPCRTLLNRTSLGDYSLNCYTGCTHGCGYCYARFMSFESAGAVVHSEQLTLPIAPSDAVRHSVGGFHQSGKPARPTGFPSARVVFGVNPIRSYTKTKPLRCAPSNEPTRMECGSVCIAGGSSAMGWRRASSRSTSIAIGTACTLIGTASFARPCTKAITSQTKLWATSTSPPTALTCRHGNTSFTSNGCETLSDRAGS